MSESQINVNQVQDAAQIAMGARALDAIQTSLSGDILVGLDGKVIYSF